MHRGSLQALLVALALVGSLATPVRAADEVEEPGRSWTWWVGAQAGGAFPTQSNSELWGEWRTLADGLGFDRQASRAALHVALSGGWRPVPWLAVEAVQSFAWLTLRATPPKHVPASAGFGLDRFLLPLAVRLALVSDNGSRWISLGVGPSLAISHTRLWGYLDTGDSWTAGVGASMAFQVYSRGLFHTDSLALGFELGWDILPVERVNPLVDDGGLVHLLNLSVGLRFVR